MSVFDPAPQRRDGLRTDLYQLTMAAAMHRAGVEHTATFELFTRRLRGDRGYWVACGLELALDYLEGLRFDDAQLAHLRGLPPFAQVPAAFFERLRGLRFSGEVWAAPEGTPLFPGEPFLRVTAPAIEAQLVETYLLSLINVQTLIATKAARVAQACAGKAFVDFGTRRAHGPEAGELAARAAFVGGAIGTSNVEAGYRLGIPVLGTFAHAWVMQWDDEDEAFRRYAEAFPEHTTLLIDTYDTLAAARRIVARELPCQAVRLDSGDLRQLSLDVRAIFDAGGREDIKIVASSDLNEYTIAEFEAAGSAIDVYGVGTDLVTSRDLPALGGVYKVVELDDGGARRYPVKVAAGKRSWPGAKQVYRRVVDGVAAGDTIALASEPAPAGEPLLTCVMRDGARTRAAPPLAAARERCLARVAELPAAVRALRAPAEYPTTRSAALVALADRERERALARCKEHA